MVWVGCRYTCAMFKRLRSDIQCILDRDPAARSKWDVVFSYPGFHAVVIHRVAHGCWQRGWTWLGRWISHWSRWLTGIEIHPGATLGERVFIDHGMGVVIGEMAEVGNDCTIYQGVTLGGTSLAKGIKRHPTLEEGVIVGANACILGGFTVGAGARVGSGAIVTKPVPPGATAVGNPAHIVQKDVSALREGSTAHLFAAYGVTPNGDDPLSKALQGLITHAVAQEQRIETILVTLKAAGICCQAVPECDKFDSEQMNKLVD